MKDKSTIMGEEEECRGGEAARFLIREHLCYNECMGKTHSNTQDRLSCVDRHINQGKRPAPAVR